MKLLEWMRRKAIDDETFAERVGGCTSHAVKKWKYGERQPPADKIIRIEEVTGGKVTLRDLVPQKERAATGGRRLLSRPIRLGRRGTPHPEKDQS